MNNQLQRSTNQNIDDGESTFIDEIQKNKKFENSQKPTYILKTLKSP